MFHGLVLKMGLLTWVVRDNEKPVRKARVRSFQAKGRPITNEEVSDGYLFFFGDVALIRCVVCDLPRRHG